MIVDVHTHLGISKFTGKMSHAETILRVMDESGIDAAVVIPALSTAKPLPAAIVAEEVAQAPDRLVGFAVVDPKE